LRTFRLGFIEWGVSPAYTHTVICSTFGRKSVSASYGDVAMDLFNLFRPLNRYSKTADSVTSSLFYALAAFLIT
jgi:hypothetical protein